MNALIEIIKKIGIFMIAAQALIHFAPGQKYEKYMKLIVGVVILFQFLKPVYGFLTGTEINWDDWNVEAFQSDYEEMAGELSGRVPEGINSSNSVADSVIMRIEEEIKSKLNEEMENETYCVVNVRVSMKTLSGVGTKQYELDKVRVVVRQRLSASNNGRDGNGAGDNNSNSMYMEPVEKVSISPISIDIDSIDGEIEGSEEENEESTEREAAVEEQLLKKFCSVLGMDEEDMEVSVYGIGNENTGQDNG